MKNLFSFIQRHVLVDGDNVVQYVLAFMPSVHESVLQASVISSRALKGSE